MTPLILSRGGVPSGLTKTVTTVAIQHSHFLDEQTHIIILYNNVFKAGAELESQEYVLVHGLPSENKIPERRDVLGMLYISVKLYW